MASTRDPEQNGGTTIRFSKLRAVRTSSTRMTYTGTMDVVNFGDANVDLDIHLETIITPDN